MIAYTYYLTDARVIKEAEAAVQGGFEVDFICLKRKSENKKDIVNRVNIYRLNQERYRGENGICYIFSYLEFLVRCFFKLTILNFIKKYKIIHINNMPDFLVFSTIIAKILGTKIILDIHDSMPFIYLTKFPDKKNSIKYKILLFQQNMSAKYADQVLTVHTPIKNDILIADGIPQDKIEIIHNFADDSLFLLNKEYHLNQRIKLIFHGTIAERFGLHKILKALSKFKDKEKVFFKIIGEGDYSDHLKEIIKTYALQNVVDFDNSFFPFHKLPEIIKNYQLGLVCYELSTATEYMLPVKMFELFSLGIPVITIPNKAIIYYLNHDMYFSYDPTNLKSLMNLLGEIVNNPKLIMEKRKIIVNQRHRFIWSHEREKYINLLNRFN